MFYHFTLLFMACHYSAYNDNISNMIIVIIVIIIMIIIIIDNK